MGTSDLTALTATQAAAGIARGDFTCEELVGALLARIAERDPQIEAWEHLDTEFALTQARAADGARREGKGIGALHGVPVGIKDIIDTADLPTEHGCPFFKGRLPLKDAACVAALKSAGAIILGKTVTTELATLTPARTRNPVDPGRTPGGSSAGSAAAVAAGMVPAALGTQTAGSVIRPASFCGIYGFKPTFGLVSRRGVLLQSHTLDTVGVLARSIEDLALLVDCMSAYDPDDPVSYPRSQPSLLAEVRRGAPLPPLFAFVKTPAWGEAEAVTQEAFAELVESLGTQVHEIELPSLADVIARQRLIQSAENAYCYGPLLKRAPDLLSPQLKERLEAGARLPARDYIAAVVSREAAYSAMEEVTDHYTAILTPAVPGVAPQGLESTGSPVFDGLWTYLGMPAVTLPLLEADGLPIGVQLVGARRDDGRLLRTARWLVEHLAQST